MNMMIKSIAEKHLKCRDQLYRILNPAGPLVYISGQISGLDEEISRQLFAQAEAEVRAMGYEPVNPFFLPHEEILHKEKNYKHQLRIDTRYLTYCEKIYMLRNWLDSEGAQFEYIVSGRIGINAIMQHDRHKECKIRDANNIEHTIYSNYSYHCHHYPTGEDWHVLGFAPEAGVLCAAGYPASIAKISDVTRITIYEPLTLDELKHRARKFGTNWF